MHVLGGTPSRYTPPYLSLFADRMEVIYLLNGFSFFRWYFIYFINFISFYICIHIEIVTAH